MKKSLLPAIALSASVFALSFLLPSAALAQQHGSKSGTKVETYLVVKITDENKADTNKIEFKVIPTSQYKDEEKRLNDEYKLKVKEWQDLRKVDSTARHPVKPTIKKIGTSYQTQTGAQKVADKLKDDEANNAAEKPKDNKQ